MNSYTTSRLAIIPLDESHTGFIYDLVNTPAWKEFIGDRQINTIDEAHSYVHRILNDPDIEYWVVSLNENYKNIGIITFIKREYLDHRDIGFAFLPEYSGLGYAREAAEEVLNDLHRVYPVILASTMPSNTKSIKLLERLGFSEVQAMVRDNDSFLLFKKVSGNN